MNRQTWEKVGDGPARPGRPLNLHSLAADVPTETLAWGRRLAGSPPPRIPSRGIWVAVELGDDLDAVDILALSDGATVPTLLIVENVTQTRRPLSPTIISVGDAKRQAYA